MISKTFRGNKGIKIIVIVAIIIRVGIYLISLQFEDIFVLNDTSSYQDTALAWLQVGRFAYSLDHLDIPETIRTPGYPFFLGLIYKLLGVDFKWVIFVQILVSLFTVIVMYKLGEFLYNPKTGNWIALAFSFDVISLAMVYKVLTETVFQFFVVLYLFLGVLWLRNPFTRTWPLLLGVSLGIGTLIRPVSLYLGLFIILSFLLWSLFNRFSWRQILIQLSLFSLPLLILIGGWQLRNAVLTGNPSLSQISGVNLLYYRGAAIFAESEGLSLDQARNRLLGDINPWQEAGLNPEKRLNVQWQKRGLDLMFQNPVVTIKMMLKSIALTLLGPGDGYLVQPLGIMTGKAGPLGDLLRLPPKTFYETWILNSSVYFFVFLYAILFLIFTYLGIMFWIIDCIRIKRFQWEDAFLWGTAFYFLFISSGPESYFRFRVPAMPILVIYGVLGWVIVLKNRVHFRTQPRIITS